MDLLTLQTLSIEDPEATVYCDGAAADLRAWLHLRCVKYIYDQWVASGCPGQAAYYIADIEERPNLLRYRPCSYCSRPLRVDFPR
jgi:hypothetical protein